MKSWVWDIFILKGNYQSKDIWAGIRVWNSRKTSAIDTDVNNYQPKSRGICCYSPGNHLVSHFQECAEVMSQMTDRRFQRNSTELLSQCMWPGNSECEVSIFNNCITDYHKLGNFKQYTFIIWLLLQVKSLGVVSWVICSGSHKAAFEVLTRQCSHPKVWMGKNLTPSSLRLLGEFISCGCRTESPNFWWLMIGGCPELLKVAHHTVKPMRTFPTWPLPWSKQWMNSLVRQSPV